MLSCALILVSLYLSVHLEETARQLANTPQSVVPPRARAIINLVGTGKLGATHPMACLQGASPGQHSARKMLRTRMRKVGKSTLGPTPYLYKMKPGGEKTEKEGLRGVNYTNKGAETRIGGSSYEVVYMPGRQDSGLLLGAPASWSDSLGV